MSDSSDLKRKVADLSEDEQAKVDLAAAVKLSMEAFTDFPPAHHPAYFNPTEMAGCDPEGMLNTFIAMSPTLPVQFHFTPCDVEDKEAHPIFKRLIPHIRKIPKIAEMATSPIKWKVRLSPRGKFIHRNRYPRRAVTNILHGEQWWLLVDYTSEAMNEHLGAYQNDNWNGFRCKNFPGGLSLEGMKDIAATATKLGVRWEMFLLKAGDTFAFDGRWWHATSYDTPVLSVFVNGGADAKVGIMEHKRRMKMPMQAKLEVGRMKTAKVSQLSDSWTHDTSGEAIPWDQK